MASGWIILDKSSGLFSRTAGARVARIFGERKFGHIGTLDPMASGVLPIAIGDATKMIPFVEDVADSVKEYEFSCVFGIDTDTLDITGAVLDRNDDRPNESDVLAALPKLMGTIAQVPPIYSAVHVGGRRAYELARRGVNVTPVARNVTIYSLEYLGHDGENWNFRARVSRGTYIRAIVRDIAAATNTIATTTMIRRRQTNGFTLKNAHSLDFLENLVNNNGDFKKFLEPVDFGLGDIPVWNLDDRSAELYRNGGFIAATGNGVHRVYCDENFIGIGVITDGVLRPKRTI